MRKFILTFFIHSRRFMLACCAALAAVWLQPAAAAFHNYPICTASGPQNAPFLLAGKAQSVWIIWEDNRSARTALYCQRLDSLGHPQLADNGIPLATTSGKQISFAAISDDDGGFIVVWQEVTSDDGDIFAQRLAANGQRLWGVSGKEVYRGSKEQSAPLVLAEGGGNVYVFWHDARTGSQDLVGQRLNAAGEKLWNTSGIELINTRRAQTLGDAAVISNRGFALTWQDESFTPARVLVQYFDQQGKAQWNAPVWVAQSTGEQSAPRILARSNAIDAYELYLAWQDRRFTVANVFAQKISTEGILLWHAEGIAAGRAAGEQQALQLLHEGADGLVVAWEDARADKGDLYAQHFDAAGKILGPPTGIVLTQAEQGQFRPRLAMTPQAQWLATWEDERGSGTNIYAQKWDAAGQAQWNSNGVVLTDHGKRNSQSMALATSAERAWIAWIDERNGNADVFAQALTLQGTVANIPPRIVSQPPELAYVGTMYSYSIAAVDYDAAATPLLALRSAPPWLKLNNATRKLEGIPVNADLGETQVVLQASDDAGASATQTFRLRVEIDTAVPRIISQPDTIAQEDARYSYVINAIDPNPQETLRYSFTSAANWLTLSQQGELSGTPTNENVAVYAINITVANSKGKTAEQQFRLHVTNTNDAPQLASTLPPRASENVAYNFRFLATDVDNGDTLIFTASRKPAWLLLASNGLASGTPTRNNLADTLITVAVTDRAGASDEKTFAIPIDLKNTKPTITSSPKTTVAEDSLYLYQIIVTDPDPNERFTLTLLQAPQWLQLDSTNKRIIGTPRNENVGSHLIAFEVRDRKGDRAQQQFSLRVENTNDAPLFTSKPDTLALVDSLYFYKPLVQDVDAGDRITLTVLAAPPWLTWDGATQSLRGTPKFTDVGVAQVNLRVEDASKAAATQTFRVRVLDLAAPDQTAPATPQSMSITPARWSSATQFVVQWQNPFDPSKIAGAYYKIGAAPTSPRDGTLVRSSGSTAIREIQVQASTEGRVPIYVWLLDGRENVDHKTAARVEYYYDRTAPLAPAEFRLLTRNGSAWIAGDTLTFAWQTATDALSGISGYTFNIDEKAVAQLTATTTKFIYSSVLKEGAHTYQIVAVDSASNRRASPRMNFRIDRTPPLVTHTPVDTLVLGQTLALRAAASDAAAGIESVRVLYRRAGEKAFRAMPMSIAGREFLASIAATELQAAGVEYVIAAVDSAGNLGFSPSTKDGVHSVVMQMAQVAAPNATRADAYQLISIPYAMQPDSNLTWLQDDLGGYDQTAWRLYSYDEVHGNVEFGNAAFKSFTAGRALWLITAKPERFATGPAQSISTAKDFTLELQPGWNLIATPFDFPTDWSAAEKSAQIETQLWSFDGKQYVANAAALLPWQGYFVRNRNSRVEKIILHAVTPPTALSKESPTLAGVARVQPHRDTILPHAHRIANDAAQWLLQLHVTNEELADHENWLGTSALAKEEWDEWEWSEPPLAPGNALALRFNQTEWRSDNGAYTTDYRPQSLQAQRWRFEIISAQAGQRVRLSLQRHGNMPPENKIILFDEQSQLAREVIFGTNDDSSNDITFRSTLTPHRFTLWVGTPEQLAQQDVQTTPTPKQFELAPAFPNPVHWQAQQKVLTTFRFSLPEANAVDLRIYDVLGRQVRNLTLSRLHVAGHHEILWDGKDDHGNVVAAGTYWCRMRTPAFAATRKLMVLKE